MGKKEVNVEDYINKSNFGDKVDSAINVLNKLEFLLDYEELSNETNIKILNAIINAHKDEVNGKEPSKEEFVNTIGHNKTENKSVSYLVEIAIKLRKWFYTYAKENEINLNTSHKILEYELDKLKNKSPIDEVFKFIFEDI